VGQLLDGVAALPTGFVVVWEQGNSYRTASVFARRFDLAGAALGRPFKVHRNSPLSRCCALVAPAPGGGFVVGWSALTDNVSGSLVVLTRFFDAAGDPLGSEPLDPAPVPLEYGFGDILVALSVDPSGVLNSIILDVADAATLLWRGRELDPDADFAPDYDVAASFAPDGDCVLARATGDTYFDWTFPSAIVARRFSGGHGSPLGAVVQLSRRNHDRLSRHPSACSPTRNPAPTAHTSRPLRSLDPVSPSVAAMHASRGGTRRAAPGRSGAKSRMSEIRKAS
jgi:hypothetical protein